ncbi:MAG: biotin/lipoyl-containing protein, partial [Pseudomonadota bacterium]
MGENIRPMTMPKWGIEMEEGLVQEWKIAEGTAVAPGDLMVIIETDKIANEVEAEFSGVLRRRIAEEGGTYKVGALIAVFAETDVSDEAVDAFVAEFKAVDASFDDGGAAPAPAAPNAPAKAAATAIPEGVLISPKAAELALRVGLDVSSVQGSGRKGRISLQDVEQAAKAQGLLSDQADDNPFTVVKPTTMRLAMVRRMVV